MIPSRFVPDRMAIRPSFPPKGTAWAEFGPRVEFAEAPEPLAWQEYVHLVPRVQLEPRHLPERSIPERFPRVRARAQLADWLSVREGEARQLGERGVPSLTVGYSRSTESGGVQWNAPEGERYLYAEYGYLRRTLVADAPEDARDRVSVSWTFDRLVRALSGDRCSLRTVDLALQARGSAAASRRDMARMERWLTAFEAFMEEQRADAERILAVLEAHPDHEGELRIEGYGTAVRHVLPSHTFPEDRTEEEVQIQGAPIVLPPDRRWFFTDVEAWDAHYADPGPSGGGGLWGAIADWMGRR